MTQKNQLTEKIVNAFAAQENTGFDKFRQVKSAVKTALKGEKEDTRFPSVRELAAALNMGTIPIQKAIMELTAENLLYSRNRVGIFVKEPSDSCHVPAVNLVESLKIFIHEMHPLKRELFFRVINDFQTNNCSIFSTNFYFEEPEDPNIFIQTAAPDPMELASIKEFLPWKEACRLCGPRTAVIAYQAMGFAWNKELFAREGYPEPAYTNYASQKEYFTQLNSLISGKITSSIHPELFLNRPIRLSLEEESFFSPGKVRELTEQFEEVLSFTGTLHYCFEKEDSRATRTQFERGKRPGFFVDSTASKGFHNEKFDFETGFYPLYDITDCVMLQPVTFQIRKKRELLYQSLQFLQYLQSPAVQESFLKENFVTVQGQLPCLGTVIPEEKMACNFTEDPFARYVMGSVIRSELLITALQKKCCKEAIRNIFAYTELIRKQFQNDHNQNLTGKEK